MTISKKDQIVEKKVVIVVFQKKGQLVETTDTTKAPVASPSNSHFGGRVGTCLE